MVATILVSVGAVTFALALLGLGGAALLTQLRRSEAITDSPVVALEAKIAALEVKVASLPSLWEDERRRATRAKDAARKHKEDAQAKLDEFEELVEAATDVRADDGEGSEDAGMLPLFPRLGGTPDSGIQDRAAAVAHLL